MFVAGAVDTFRCLGYWVAARRRNAGPRVAKLQSGAAVTDQMTLGGTDSDGCGSVVGLYTSQSQIDAQLKVLDSFRENHLDFGWLSGKNWTINCGTRPLCEKVPADMGGSIRRGVAGVADFGEPVALRCSVRTERCRAADRLLPQLCPRRSRGGRAHQCN